jgi:hypothetical protein
MPGFRHSPFEDIQRIRQDLRDRYHEGFPILKELIQNADDAGAGNSNAAATRFVIVLCKEGLPGATHTLLRGAGLCIFNDGSFTAEDANSITSLGLSNKAGQEGAAGKFGLGLKSIFHWAESFFYFSPCTFTGDPKLQSSGCELLNPWWSRYAETGRHKEWDEEWQKTKQDDLQAFSQLARETLNTARWFGLWIPLRTTEHTTDGTDEVKPIEARFPKADLNEILGKDWTERLAAMVPLLRRVHTVQACEHSGAALTSVLELQVNEGAKRMRFGTADSPSSGVFNANLAGKVSSSNGLSEIHFAGHEQLVQIAALDALKRHKAWPNQSSMGPNYEDIQVPEKGLPHGAVLFTRQIANSQSWLNVQPAVFLPLGEPEQNACKGGWRYHLHLHGFFFVDSGRRQIQNDGGLSENLTPEGASSESEVIRLWNRILMREVVAPLVLPALKTFVQQESMEPAEIEALVGSLQRSNLIETLIQWICAEYRFIHRLRSTGSEWVLEKCLDPNGKPSPWVELPMPDFPESELLLLVPGLAELGNQATVCLKGTPSLANQKPKRLSDEQLAILLNKVPVSAFEDATRLEYILTIIPDDASQRPPDLPLSTRLVEIANLLLVHSQPENEQLRKLWGKFFQRLPAQVFIRVPCDSTKIKPEIASVLAKTTLPVALIWQDLHENEGQGVVAWDVLLPLLQSLGALNLADAPAIRQRSQIAFRLLQACPARPKNWADSVNDLSLFHSRRSGGMACAVSIKQLRAANVEELLFVGGDAWAVDLIKAFPEISPLLVDKALADILGLATSDCGISTCATVLRKKSRLAEDFANRKALFDRMLSAATPDGQDAWAALRCLIHGQVSDWANTSSIFRETGSDAVFIKLARKALVAVGQSWRLIPKAITDQLALNADQVKALNLTNTSASDVESLIKEVAPENVDCADLSRDDCDILLRQFNDVSVLRGLNIHDSLNSRRVPIAKHTYVDDGTFKGLPPAFDQLVTRIRYNANYARLTSPDESIRLVDALSWEAVIEIAIDEDRPDVWAETILTAIGNRGTLRLDLKKRVQTTPWIPLSDGKTASPKALLHVPGADTELDKLPDDIIALLVPLSRTASLVQQHPSFGTFKTTILPTPKEALAALGLLLTPHHEWSTGLSGEWQDAQISDWVKGLSNAPEQTLPVARLVKAFHNEPVVAGLLSDFLGCVSKPLTESAYAAIMVHLASVHNNAEEQVRQRLERVFSRYLKSVAANGDAFLRRVIEMPGLTLLSAAGSWKPPAQLTFVRNGVAPDYVISPAFEPPLSSLVRPIAAAQVVQAQLRFPWPGEMPQRATATAQRLKEYFEPWRQYLISPEPIGFLLSVMGTASEIEAVAESFLSVHTVDWIRDWLDQHEQARRHRLRQRLNSCLFLLEGIERGQTLRVLSILGRPLFAKRQRGGSSVFVGDQRDAFEIFRLEPGKVICQGRLLDLSRDLETLSPQELIGLLERSMQVILGYLDSEVDTTALWEAAKKASQLHVRVAQSMIIDGAIGFLRQVGAQRHPDIKLALAKWDEARRFAAEEENHGVKSDRAEQRQREAKAALQRLLSEDPRVHQVVLAAVRDKISEFQYNPTSVPFEIWQNADDAIAELDRLGRDATAAISFGFVARESKNECYFAHLGRLINEFQCSGGRSCRDDGFDRDLEKMLVTSISDKGDAPARGGPALTGKFGLGFKSLFLVSDEPKVLSGSVDFAIRGGIYPVRLADSSRDALLAVLTSFAQESWRRGTIIHLPLRADVSIEVVAFLTLFRRLAPLLVVFSRRLKRFRFVTDREPMTELHWQPKPLFNGDVELGSLAGLDAHISSALTFSSATEPGKGKLTFLLAMGPDGIVPLPGDVPVFWVTAPTRATPGYGFAVNGPFEPDVGRVQLAIKSERNQQVADELAHALQSRLQALCERATSNWESLRHHLQLSSGVSPCDFWQSLWDVLGRGFAQHCPATDNSTEAQLARRILWGSEASGLRRFYTDSRALPTGLSRDYRALTSLPKVRYFTAGALENESVFQAVTGWKAFQERIAIGAICSGKQLVSVLDRLGVPLRDAEPIHLVTLVDWELGKEKQVDAESALHFGALITPEFMNSLANGKLGERDEIEHKKLVEVLRAALFQAADGSWHKPAELLLPASVTGAVEDEQLRAAFAPASCQLHPSYQGAALQFFLSARPQLEAGVDRMVEWVLTAASEPTQVAALTYLLNGADHLRHSLATSLRACKDSKLWLWNLDSFTWFSVRFSEEQRREILAHILKLFEQELKGLTTTTGDDATPPPPPPKHIWSVQELWIWWERLGFPTGEYTLEGEANWPLFHGGPIVGKEERRAELTRLLCSKEPAERNPLWYRLFGYACLVSAGRHTTELREFWLERLNSMKFWELTSGGDFSENTFRIFEQAVTTTFRESGYYWRRVFYDIRKVHRMVCINDFPSDLMRLVQEGHGQHLLTFLREGRVPGPDQPQWLGTFGQSSDRPLGFIIRELVRLKVITDPDVLPHAFFVCRPVLRALSKIGWIEDEDEGYSGERWLTKLAEDPVHGPKLQEWYDLPLLHMGVTHRGDQMPIPPRLP